MDRVICPRCGLECESGDHQLPDSCIRALKGSRNALLALLRYTHEALKKSKSFVGIELIVLEKSFLPGPTEEQQRWMADARELLEIIERPLSLIEVLVEEKKGD